MLKEYQNALNNLVYYIIKYANVNILPHSITNEIDKSINILQELINKERGCLND